MLKKDLGSKQRRLFVKKPLFNLDKKLFDYLSW